jgi:hypothetical protein
MHCPADFRDTVAAIEGEISGQIADGIALLK